ncbi:hypothetical protein [Chryseobacterium scophthalmum]|nr:hypothetical protein [Chryseobacterium scophthalmum]
MKIVTVKFVYSWRSIFFSQIAQISTDFILNHLRKPARSVGV